MYSLLVLSKSNVDNRLSASFEFEQAEIKVHQNIDEIKEESQELLNLLNDITYAKFRDNNLYSAYIEANYKRLRKIENDGNFYGFAALNTFWNSQCTYFDIETVDGLANIDSGGIDRDYLGVLINKPITAKRETNEEHFDRTKWANEQYEIICKNGLMDEDKLFLPYVLGKYAIDMTDVMAIKVMNKKDGNKNF